MQRKETKTELVRRISVKDSSGNSHTVVEWGDFLRVIVDGGWSPWMRNGGRLKLDNQPVNQTDDPNVFELVMTGEKLTAVSPETKQTE